MRRLRQTDTRNLACFLTSDLDEVFSPPISAAFGYAYKGRSRSGAICLFSFDLLDFYHG